MLQYISADFMPSGIVDKDIAKGFGVRESLVAIYLLSGVEEGVREIIGSGLHLEIQFRLSVIGLVMLYLDSRMVVLMGLMLRERREKGFQGEMNMGRTLFRKVDTPSRWIMLWPVEVYFYIVRKSKTCRIPAERSMCNANVKVSSIVVVVH